MPIKSKNKKFLFVIISTFLIFGIGGTTYYWLQNSPNSPIFHNDESKNETIPIILAPPAHSIYHWANIILSWNITTNSSTYQYFCTINDILKFSETNISLSQINFTIGPFSAGIYNITLKVTDDKGFSNQNSTILNVLQDQDSDKDLLFDHQEIELFQTDPNLNDTDGDFLEDGSEILTYFTDPLKNDTDLDLLGDGSEVFVYFTNPIINDTDSDGLIDGAEIFEFSTNPLSNDTDSDGCDDFSELKFYYTDPLNADCSATNWDGGLIEITVEFRPDEPHFIPYAIISERSTFKIPRLLYIYLTERIRYDRLNISDFSYQSFNSSTGNNSSKTFYISAIQRISPIRILVIDNFNSTDYAERIHGNTCVTICKETLSTIFGTDETTQNFLILSYSVSESNRSWGTAFQYAIAQGVDVISLSQVSTYGSTPFFDEISECVEKYHIVFSAGSGNDNRGDPVLNATNNLRYPATHPDTLVVGGIIQNTHVNPSQWERWNEGPGNPGSNWGRGVVNYNNTNYYSAVELVADCKRHIAFSDYYGVSWAIPQIAGMAAALIYSNSLLTPSDVRILLISTAIQITPSLYNYTSSPFTNSTNWPTGWNPEVGYGMPDINLAITQALSIYI